MNWYVVRLVQQTGSEIFSARVPLAALTEAITLAGRLADSYARTTAHTGERINVEITRVNG